jgi:quercetin dioxygenase-like cupin family protein
MSPSAYGNTSGSDVRESRELMDRLMTFALTEEIESLRSEPAWEENEKNSRTLAKDVDFRVLLSVLHTDATLAEHDGEARASLHVLDGEAELAVEGGGSTRLSAGSMAVVNSGQAWTLRAVSDCAVLLTLAWPIEKAGV